DQNESDAAGHFAAVGPAVVGAALDYDVARARDGLAFVDDQRDLAFQHDAVVDRLRAMHERVLRAAAAVRGGVGGTDFGKVSARLLRRQLRDARVLRRHFEHANARAVLRRRELNAFLGRLAGGAVDSRRRLARVPYLEE